MEAQIESLSPKGLGVTASGQEIAHTLPGDLIRKLKGQLPEILQPSPLRTDPKCKHAHYCGGCIWQQMHYKHQLKEKETRIKLAFGIKPNPIIATDFPFEYRNKMEFHFSENKAGEKFLGLMIAQSRGHVFNLTECHLTSPWFAETLSNVRAWWHASNLHAYFPPGDRDSLRYITMREAKRGSGRMVILNVSGNPAFALTRQHLDSFVQAVGADTSIFLRIHQIQKGSPTQFFEMHLAGLDHITETLHLKSGALSFKISPASFFQPNTLSAEKLYDAALQHLSPCDTVYDLYCGTGTLGMAASRIAREVIGIELSAEAVLDAEENCRRNQISNFRIIQGDVGKVLSQLSASRPNTVIVDPPRIGLDPLAISHLKALSAEKIIYISCNPITQAQNIQELLSAGYTIKRLLPVDQFPHTYHIENIAILERKPHFGHPE